MRIAYLNDSKLPSTEANGIHVVRMADAWTDLGHHVEMVGRPGTTHSSLDLRSFYGTRNDLSPHLIGQTGPPLIRRWERQRQVHRLLDRLGPFDVIYGRSTSLLNAVTLMGVPLVYEMHQLPPHGPGARLEKRLLRSPHLRRIVAISEALAHDVASHYDVADTDVIVAHDAADPPRSDGTPSHPGGCLRVGYLGSFYPGRGLELVGRIAHALPDVEFHLAGGDETPGSLRLPNVHLHGRLDPGTVSAFYRSLDIALAPYQTRVTVAGGGGDISRWMSPMKIFEYLAHGLPIVASDLPVLREVLDESIAVLAPPDADSAWIEAIRSLGVDQARRARMSRAAHERFLERHTWSARAETVLRRLEP